jgi:hypothetical protein
MKKMLKSTHQGILKINDTDLPCAVLSDGTRILSQNAVLKAFGRKKRGRYKNDTRVQNMPAFLDAKNLQSLIDNELRGAISEVKYLNEKDKEVTGYKAEIIPLICNLYLEARIQGVLLRQQLPLAMVSEILVRSLSKIGILALIDEATGYQEVRDRNELQKILKAYISEELLPWTKRFPDEFYKEMFRLNNWDFNPVSVKRPSVIGTWTNKLIYKQLPKGVLTELKTNTPRDSKGRTRHRFHQLLTSEIGNPHLEKQLVSVITLMNVSSDWKDFQRLFAKKFGQQTLDI